MTVNIFIRIFRFFFSRRPVRVGPVIFRTIHTIDDMAKAAYDNSKAHGFWDGVADVEKVLPEKVALIHSEASEILEAYRASDLQLRLREDGKPEGLGPECADILIRVGDYYRAWWLQEYKLGRIHLTLEDHVNLKHAFNLTRPHMHGKTC